MSAEEHAKIIEHLEKIQSKICDLSCKIKYITCRLCGCHECGCKKSKCSCDDNCNCSDKKECSKTGESCEVK